MKVYPNHLEELIQEESKKAIIDYPVSFLKIILRFQIAHQIVEGGHKLTREDVAVLMMKKGSEAIQKDTAKYCKQFNEDQNEKFNADFLKKSKSFIKPLK